MSDMRVVRTLAVPLGIAVLFLVFTPKLCQTALVTAKHKRPVAITPIEPSRSGLIINSSTPAPATKELRFPPGLDTTRIQYLVEINQQFSAPLTITATDAEPLTKILIDRHYFEKRPDGTLAPTHDGLINVGGAVESPSGWIVPVGKRKFVAVMAIEDAGDGRYDAIVRWRWEPTAIGAALVAKPEDHHLKAEFGGGAGNWVLTRFITEPDREFR